MEIIGIICEYNPFHHGHAYHIKKIKAMYPNSLIILVLNGYFLERGEISVINKEVKTKIALKENVDIVVELPFVFGTNSADIFAESAVTILNHLGVEKLIFGSESNDIKLLTALAKAQLKLGFDAQVKTHLKAGANYPTALSKALGENVSAPNDLLGIAYIKAIIKNKFKIEPISIQRTNDYHDLTSDEEIISASNIRAKVKNGHDVKKYTDYQTHFNKVNEELFLSLLKYKINTEPNLAKYLTVDEGIEHKLIKVINQVASANELIKQIKSKRYTYNRLQRMLIHILIGLTKADKAKLRLEYIKLLGFNQTGQAYLKKIKPTVLIPLMRKIPKDYLAQSYELKAAFLYDLLTGDKTLAYELANKPISKN